MALDPTLQALLDKKRRRDREALFSRLAQTQTLQEKSALDTSEFEAISQASQEAAKPRETGGSLAGLVKGISALRASSDVSRSGGDQSLSGALGRLDSAEQQSQQFQQSQPPSGGGLGLAGAEESGPTLSFLQGVQDFRSATSGQPTISTPSTPQEDQTLNLSEVENRTSFIVDPENASLTAREIANKYESRLSQIGPRDRENLLGRLEAEFQFNNPPTQQETEREFGLFENRGFGVSETVGEAFGDVGRGVLGVARGVGEFQSAIRGQTSLSSRQEAQDIRNSLNRFMQAEGIYKTAQRDIGNIVMGLEGEEQSAALDDYVQETERKYGPKASGPVRSLANSPHQIAGYESLGELLNGNPVAQQAWIDNELSTYFRSQRAADDLLRTPKAQAQIKTLNDKKTGIINLLEKDGSNPELLVSLRDGTGSVEALIEAQGIDGLVAANAPEHIDNAGLSFMRTYNDLFNLRDDAKGRQDKVDRKKANEQLARDFIKARGTGPRISVLDKQTNETLLLNQNDPRLNKDPGRFERLPLRQETGPPGSFDKSQSRARAEALERAQQGQFGLTAAMRMMENLQRAGPHTTGLRGVVALEFAKFGGQVFQADTVDRVVQLITASGENPAGFTQQELNEQRVSFRAFIAQSVRELVGEEGARISDRELQIAMDTLMLLDPTATREMIEGGLAALMQLNILKNILNTEVATRKRQFDLSTEQGEDDFFRAIRSIRFSNKEGLSNDIKARLLEDVKNQQERMDRFGGIQQFVDGGGLQGSGISPGRLQAFREQALRVQEGFTRFHRLPEF